MEPQTSAVPTPPCRGFRNISGREYLWICFSVIAAENPRLCDFLLWLFVWGSLEWENWTMRKEMFGSSPRKVQGVTEGCAPCLGNLDDLRELFQPKQLCVCILSWAEFPALSQMISTFPGHVEGWRAKSISFTFVSQRSWFYELVAQLNFILIPVKKFQPGLTSTTLGFHCEHFLQLFRVFCCCKEQLIWGTIIPGFKAYIHMVIKAACNSITEITDDCCSILKVAGVFFLSFILFCFPGTYSFSSAQIFADLTSKLVMWPHCVLCRAQ